MSWSFFRTPQHHFRMMMAEQSCVIVVRWPPWIMLIVQATARDPRNGMAIRSWAAGLPTTFRLKVPKAAGRTEII